MIKQLLIVECISVLVIVFSGESNGDLISQITDLTKFGQCGMAVKDDPNFMKCKDQVTENWSAEQNPKKQACCKPLGFIKCSMETAKEKCQEAQVTFFETQQKSAIKLADPACLLYTENPSMCGTGGLLPLLSMIFISILVVLRIS